LIGRLGVGRSPPSSAGIITRWTWLDIKQWAHIFAPDFKESSNTSTGIRYTDRAYYENISAASMEAVVELLSILGKDKLEDLEPEDINRRVGQSRQCCELCPAVSLYW
jgi:hypothetical protein